MNGKGPEPTEHKTVISEQDRVSISHGSGPVPLRLTAGQ